MLTLGFIEAWKKVYGDQTVDIVIIIFPSAAMTGLTEA